MNECVFCQIANGDPKKLVWSNDLVAVFESIEPEAPTHLLVVPKRHVASLDDLDDPGLAGELVLAARRVAQASRLHDSWRMLVNVGKNGGQVVFHLHLHVLGRSDGIPLD